LRSRIVAARGEEDRVIVVQLDLPGAHDEVHRPFRIAGSAGELGRFGHVLLDRAHVRVAARRCRENLLPSLGQQLVHAIALVGRELVLARQPGKDHPSHARRQSARRRGDLIGRDLGII
jgi:hypothetical protein